MKDINEKTVSNWKETIEELKNNLDCCGINSDYLSPFATYIYSAYINKIPILLAGKNTIEVAKAISYIFNGNDICILDCNRSIDKTFSNEVVIIKNFINSDKTVEITDLLIKRDKFYLINVSHFEDLCFLPSSFFNYALPVVLDYIIDEAFVFDKLVYCNKTKIYTDSENKRYNLFENKKKLKKLMDTLRISRLSQWNYLKIFSESYSLGEAININTDIIVFMLPYAYITTQLEILKTFMLNNSFSKKIIDFIEILSN